MKVKEFSFVKGSTCNFCNKLFDNDDDIVFSSSFRECLKVMCLQCNGKKQKETV